MQATTLDFEGKMYMLEKKGEREKEMHHYFLGTVQLLLN